MTQTKVSLLIQEDSIANLIAPQFKVTLVECQPVSSLGSRRHTQTRWKPSRVNQKKVRIFRVLKNLPAAEMDLLKIMKMVSTRWSELMNSQTIKLSKNLISKRSAVLASALNLGKAKES